MLADRSRTIPRTAVRSPARARSARAPQLIRRVDDAADASVPAPPACSPDPPAPASARREGGSPADSARVVPIYGRSPRLVPLVSPRACLAGGDGGFRARAGGEPDRRRRHFPRQTER